MIHTVISAAIACDWLPVLLHANALQWFMQSQGEPVPTLTWNRTRGFTDS